MSKISVIIPVYNVEKYLRECLDSVINQTYKDIEIICVEDCGNDNSIKLVEEYAERDNRIKIIQHDKNRGLGPARNTGLYNATGDYVFFLDSDDYLVENAIEILYNKIIETNSDFVVTRAEAFADDNSEETITRAINMNDWLDRKSLDNYQVNLENYEDTLVNYNCVSWGKLFKKDFLTKNNLRFIDGNYVHEDNGFWIKVLSIFPNISYVEKVGLMYRIRQNALTSEIDRKKNKKKKFNHMKIVLKDSFDYIEKNCCNEMFKLLISLIRNSEFYLTFFEVKTWYLKYRWLKNNKRLSLLGLPLFREKPINEKNKIGKLCGIPIYKQKITNNIQRLLIHIHIYYYDQVDYFIEKLQNISNVSSEVYITYVEDNEKELSKFKKLSYFKIHFCKVENVGYDVYPFIFVLNQVDLDKFDFILKLHTKAFQEKEPLWHGKGYRWRDVLVDSLLESKKQFLENIQYLNRYKKIGMIGNSECISDMSGKSPEDTYLYDKFCSDFNLSTNRGHFIGGTMFICRAKLMQGIKDLHLTEQDFQNSKSTGDCGTLAHVMERIFGTIIEQQGYIINSCNSNNKQKNNILKTIFSITNDANKIHKIITILGIKIKVDIKSSSLIVDSFRKKYPQYLSLGIILKNEAKDIKEWIEYHRLIGVEKFYIYDNGSTDNIKEILEPYIDKKIVDYKYYPGKSKQVEAYNDIIDRCKYQTKWIGLIDVDEFILPIQNDNLQDILKSYEKYSGLGINWMCFDSNGHNERPNGLVIENYTRIHKNRELFLEEYHIKSIVNPRLVKYFHVHNCDFYKGTNVDEDMKPIVQQQFTKGHLFESYNNRHDHLRVNCNAKKIIINHYWSKSKEDYLERVDKGTANYEFKGSYHESRLNFKEYQYNTNILKYIERLKTNMKKNPCLNLLNITKLKEPSGSFDYKFKKACIFASYNKKGKINNNIIKYLKELKKYNDYIIFVADNSILEKELKKIDKIVDSYIFKRHEEYDFGSYKRGYFALKELGILNNIDNLLFCNDSVKFIGKSLKEVFKASTEKDFFGITENLGGYKLNDDKYYSKLSEPHIQSYFYILSKDIFNSSWLENFYSSIKKEENKINIIVKYEIGLSKLIKKYGYNISTYYEFIREKNPYICYLKPKAIKNQIFLKKNC